MIDYKKQEIGDPGKMEPIHHFAIKWKTPCGVFTNLEDAVGSCESYNIPISMGISPIVIAVSPNFFEVL